MKVKVPAEVADLLVCWQNHPRCDAVGRLLAELA
jgi:hypothetical protein